MTGELATGTTKKLHTWYFILFGQSLKVSSFTNQRHRSPNNAVAGKECKLQVQVTRSSRALGVGRCARYKYTCTQYCSVYRYEVVGVKDEVYFCARIQNTWSSTAGRQGNRCASSVNRQSIIVPF